MNISAASVGSSFQLIVFGFKDVIIRWSSFLRYMGKHNDLLRRGRWQGPLQDTPGRLHAGHITSSMLNVVITCACSMSHTLASGGWAGGLPSSLRDACPRHNWRPNITVDISTHHILFREYITTLH